MTAEEERPKGINLPFLPGHLEEGGKRLSGEIGWRFSSKKKKNQPD